MRRAISLLLLAVTWSMAAQADERPRRGETAAPLSPEESSRAVKLPEGFTLELVASKPLIAHPSSICWDERGRLYVGEWRNSGTIKRLRDDDGDGRMDQAQLWADQLPPCHAIRPARGGLIAACDSELFYLADRDEDGRAEVREVLPAGFATPPRDCTWNESGDCFVTSTHTLASQVEPLAVASLPRDNEDPAEAPPRGAFASACSPLVYQDAVLPGLRGQLFVCEPARNVVHRRVLHRTGLRYRLERASGDEQRDFLTSPDPWFQPRALSHGPDGRLWIVDVCRPQSDDAATSLPPQSPRRGEDGPGHGRIWRLTRRDAPSPERLPPADMRRLTADQLAQEVTSPLLWRRETARRLIVETSARSTMAPLSHAVRNAGDATGVINALSTLDALDSLNSELLEESLADTDPAVRQHALRLSQKLLDKRPRLLDVVLGMTGDADARVRLQVATALGETRSARALPALAKIGRGDGDDPWVRRAILHSCAGRERELRQVLLESPQSLGQARSLVPALGAE